MKHDLNAILDLVRSGRLQDATDAIQDRLRGPSDAAVDADPASMKDVTPPRPKRPAGPAKAKARRAPRSAREPGEIPGRWERRAGPVPYRLFTPDRIVADAPLLVMLHGCTQTPEDFAAGTRMNVAAAGIGARVVWPEQLRAANPNGCWNWFEPAHQGRSGEAAAIAAVIRDVAATAAPDASGIHVAGLSAGGAMAAILGTAYPEMIASVGIHSGLPAGAARDTVSAFAAMRSGAPAGTPLAVPAIVFHGTADRIVSPANGAAIATAGQPGDRLRKRTVLAGGRTVAITTVEDAGGGAGRELWEVEGLGHAWSGGDAAGSYADPEGPDATAEMLRFFKDVDRRSARRR